MMPGVFPPTPSSRNRILPPRRLSRKSSYRAAALCQPSSSTNVSSARRFMDMGRPHTGQRGTRSEGTDILASAPSGSVSAPAESMTNPCASAIFRTDSSLS